MAAPVSAPIQVLVVDDHPIVLDGVTLALQNQARFRIVGSARTGRDAITLARILRPDVVLLDFRLPDMLAPEIIQSLRAHRPEGKIVVFTAYPDHSALEVALAAGADGVIVKDTERSDLVDVIQRVVGGERVINADLAEDTAMLLARRLRASGLTRREYEILRRVAMGETNPQIAVALGLSRNTVKTYLQRTLEKLGAHNRIGALSRANELGIL
jgi:two-component system nitrate/nitrite response regulator NarL